MKRKPEHWWGKLSGRVKMGAGLVTGILTIAGLGYGFATTYPTYSDLNEVDNKARLAGAKADYVIQQQIESARAKANILREKYRNASPKDREAIKLDLDYWNAEIQRLESVRKTGG